MSHFKIPIHATRVIVALGSLMATPVYAGRVTTSTAPTGGQMMQKQEDQGAVQSFATAPPDGSAERNQKIMEMLVNGLGSVWQSSAQQQAQSVSGSPGSSEVASPDDTAQDSGPKMQGPYRPQGANELSGTCNPIVPVFQQYFDKCAVSTGLGTCKFNNMGIAPDARHKAERSCHNTNSAIDVGDLTCANGGHIDTQDQRFVKMVVCMRMQSDDRLRVIHCESKVPGRHPASASDCADEAGGQVWKKADHWDHMHVQITGCPMITYAEAKDRGLTCGL